MLVREWTAADAPAVDALLDADPDPLWAAQGHRLHGVPRDGERWRRSFVGEQDGVVVGAVTIGRNYVHPGRYSCAVEVAPARRGRGLGRQLVEVARDARPEQLPLSAKMRERDRAAAALLARLGGEVYQRAPCPVVVPDEPRVVAWCAAHAGAAQPLATLDPTAQARAYADMYRWLHEGWSPVGSESALAEMSAAMMDDLDGDVGAGVWRDDRLSAAAFAFRDGDGLECVTETMRRDEPDGVAALAAAIAAMLTAATRAAIATVEFDGHDDDPHLAPIIRTLPVSRADPLLLVGVR